MTARALRSIGSNDFAVIDDGYPVGRIRLAAERGGQTWMLELHHSRARRPQRHRWQSRCCESGVRGIVGEIQSRDRAGAIGERT
jgi:hypothetical protein